MVERTCATPGCDKPHRARGLCSTHYNRTYAPDRHRTDKVCEVCGTGYTTTRTNGRYCSLACRDAESRARKAVVGPLPWVRPDTPGPPPRRTLRTWVAGRCAWCDAGFVARLYGTPDRYCSRECATRGRDKRHATSARQRGIVHQKWISPQRRYAIYARDSWTCHLCAEPVDPSLPYNDPWAASLDHLTPRALGGTHDDDNLRLAHRWCNAVREQAEAVGLFVAGGM